MQALESVNVIPTGLEGDRYATEQGAWSRVRKEIPRHISLIELETLTEILERHDVNIPFAVTRRNLLTTGVELNPLVGKRFRIGDVLVEGVELCDPCARPGKLSGNPVLQGKQRPELGGFKTLLETRGGLRVRIIETGVLNVGDAIELEA